MSRGVTWILLIGNAFLTGQATKYALTVLLQLDAVTYAELNGKAYIECFATGNPTPEITWLMGGGDLPPGAQVTSAGQLFFPKVTKRAEGTYICTATNSGGTIQAQGSLELQYPPIWTEEIESKSADLASTVSWSCSADSVPNATYTWWKDGVQMSENDADPAVQILYDEAFTTLIISNLRESHSGMYQCAVKNEYGNTISSAQLQVNSLRFRDCVSQSKAEDAYLDTRHCRGLCGRPHGSRRWMIDPTNGKCGCYTCCSDNFWSRRHGTCTTCEGSFTNSKANIRRSCRERRHPQMPTTKSPSQALTTAMTHIPITASTTEMPGSHDSASTRIGAGDATKQTSTQSSQGISKVNWKQQSRNLFISATKAGYLGGGANAVTSSALMIYLITTYPIFHNYY